MKPRMVVFFFVALGVAAVLLGLYSFAAAAEVESIRDSEYEWTCEDASGTVISGHTRQDKAFQSCYNAALAATAGEIFYVRGGLFRVTATGTEVQPPEPPIEPPVEPEPPDPDPTPKPQVTFGPVSALTEYPATISALKQQTFRWVVKFTLNSVTGKKGLFSRDENGTLDPGHWSLWVENGQLILRHQDSCPNCGGSGESFKLLATTPIVAGQEYVAIASMSLSEGTSLWLDGELQGSDPRSWGLDKNNLPLIVGGLCSNCKLTADPPLLPHDPIDGTVYMEIWDDAMPLPQPTSLELNWVNPTEYEDGRPIGPGELTEIRLYQDGILAAGVDPDQSTHEVTGLMPGHEYCFEATAVAELESERSNQVCRRVQ